MAISTPAQGGTNNKPVLSTRNILEHECRISWAFRLDLPCKRAMSAIYEYLQQNRDVTKCPTALAGSAHDWHDHSADYRLLSDSHSTWENGGVANPILQRVPSATLFRMLLMPQCRYTRSCPAARTHGRRYVDGYGRRF